MTAGAAPVGELSYSDAGAELDEIIAEFETGVVDVDRLVDQLERATEIVDELDRRLGAPGCGWRSWCRASRPSARRWDGRCRRGGPEDAESDALF